MLSIERTPLSFEIEHPEVGIALHIVDQSRLQLLCRVRKTAVVSILTSGGGAVGPVRILGLCAVFAFVLLRVVDWLDSVVGERAFVALRTLWAILQLQCVLAQVRLWCMPDEGEQFINVLETYQLVEVCHEWEVEGAAAVFRCMPVSAQLYVVLLADHEIAARLDLEQWQIEILDDLRSALLLRRLG
jgi:hypothetical protein